MKNRKLKKLKFLKRHSKRRQIQKVKRAREKKILKELETGRQVYQKETGQDLGDMVQVRKQNIRDRVHNREVTAGWAAEARKEKKGGEKK